MVQVAMCVITGEAGDYRYFIALIAKSDAQLVIQVRGRADVRWKVGCKQQDSHVLLCLVCFAKMGQINKLRTASLQRFLHRESS